MSDLNTKLNELEKALRLVSDLSVDIEVLKAKEVEQLKEQARLKAEAEKLEGQMLKEAKEKVLEPLRQDVTDLLNQIIIKLRDIPSTEIVYPDDYDGGPNREVSENFETPDRSLSAIKHLVSIALENNKSTHGYHMERILVKYYDSNCYGGY